MPAINSSTVTPAAIVRFQWTTATVRSRAEQRRGAATAPRLRRRRVLRIQVEDLGRTSGSPRARRRTSATRQRKCASLLSAHSALELVEKRPAFTEKARECQCTLRQSER